MKTITRTILVASLCGAMGMGLMACESHDVKPASVSEQAYIRDQSQAALARFRSQNQTMRVLIDNAYAYAVFPEVGKGGLGVGAAHGHGVVYEQGTFIGYADMTQGTIGAQAGGQQYAEIILFEDKAALEHFKRGNMELAAQASAVAADKAANADANYENGVIVYTMGKTGLMFEAAVGGQKFRYTPA